MTTAATVVGHFPLVIATGPGAGARNSIGIMLVSGMIIGTIFTLFVVPSIYVLVARTHAAVAADDAVADAAGRCRISHTSTACSPEGATRHDWPRMAVRAVRIHAFRSCLRRRHLRQQRRLRSRRCLALTLSVLLAATAQAQVEPPTPSSDDRRCG